MVYIMRMKVDGGCRRNGYHDAIGAAAVVVYHKGGASTSFAWDLPNYPRPTNQRAELLAIIHALEMARHKASQMSRNPFMKITIFTDSRYAHGCLTDWSYKWRNNGWVNAAGKPVVNRDLVQQAVNLEADVERNGEVTYCWIPRPENEDADRAVNVRLDERQQNAKASETFYLSSDDGYY